MGERGAFAWKLASRQSRREEESFRDRFLGEKYLILDGDSIPSISNHIDYFVRQCQSNRSIKRVILYLYPYEFGGQDDSILEKVGQAIGNLRALDRIIISISYNTNIYDEDEDEDGDEDEDEDEDTARPEWKVVARILSHVRQIITLSAESPDVSGWRAEDIRSFARVIHGHPTITCFEEGDMFPFRASDTLYSALATLPFLESITLRNRGRRARREVESTMAHHESLTELLRVPSLWSVCFCYNFTRAHCQATADALMEGTVVAKLEFRACSFSDEECSTILANALSRNTSVSCIEVVSSFDEALCKALITVLPSNLTLRRLGLVVDDGSPDLSPVILALGENTGIKTLQLEVYGSMDESLCTAMQNGLGMNETLESLELNDYQSNENSAMWCRALCFLRTNKSLKSLMVTLEDDAETEYVPESMMEAYVSAFCIDIAAILQENASLERLSIEAIYGGIYRIEIKELFVLVTALQHNTALKSLTFNRSRTIQLKGDQRKQMASLLKKNYALESLPDINHQGEDMSAILRLNEAGRRYLVQDGSSISKGVEVLSKVNDDINCVFLHLLDNPRLCDRSAVEMVTADESNNRSPSPTASSDGGGKREQASAHKGKESRRRLA
jgi:hypothetical protein